MGELVDVNVHSLQYIRMNHDCKSSFVKEKHSQEFSFGEFLSEYAAS